MAIQDTPVGEYEAPSFFDAPIEEVKTAPRNEANDNLVAVEAAFLDNYVNGAPVAESFFTHKDSNRQYEAAENLSKQKAEMDSLDVAEELLGNPGDSEDEILVNTSAAMEANNNIEKADTEQHFAESALGPDGSLEDADKVATDLRLQKMLNEWQSEISGGDKFVEVGKAFTVPFLESARGIKLTGEYFGAKEEVQSAIRAFRNLPEEEQVKIFPSLKREIVDKVGDVDAIGILSSFLEPGGDQNFDRYGGEEVVWDILDATGVGYALTWAFRKTSKAASTVKTLKDLRNHRAAEEAATGAVVDPEIASAMGLDETAAVANALPFDTSVEIIERQGGLSNKITDGLKEYFDEADAVTRDINTGTGFLREQTVSNSYRNTLEDAAKQKFQAEKAENIRITGKSDTTTTFEYQVLDEAGELTDKTYELKLDLNNSGEFEQSTIGLIREYVGSPTAFARGMLKEDVKTAERIDYLQSRMNEQLKKLTRDALRPVGLVPTPKNKESLAKVDKVLREGDEWKNSDGSRGTVFSPDDLRTKFGLTEKESSAYYRVNRLYNNLWHIRNTEKRKEMDTLGYRNVSFTENGDSSFGKTYENALTARSSLHDKSINQIYDATTDSILDLKTAKSDIISESYANDKVLVKMDDPYELAENRGMFRYALVNADEVGDLPQQVLHRKSGYVPRIYEDAAYFVKERKRATVDGDKDHFYKSTLRFFDNKKDADTYRNGLKESYVAKQLEEVDISGMEPSAVSKLEEKLWKEADETYIRLSDREEETLSAASGEVSHGSGGLYTGARAQDDILFGLEGDRANRVNSFDSLMRNIGNVSRYASINQWRLGMEQRWINTANRIMKDKGQEANITKFERLAKTSESSPEVRFLNKVFDQIRDWQGFPTPEEQFFSNVMRGFYDWTADRDHKKMAKLLGNFKDVDPVAAARATAFHTLLGFFNPAQLWVQAQGAAVAVSVGAGKHLTRSMGNTMALSMLGHGAVDSKRLGMLAKASKQDKAELEALHNAWVKTGYQDSVLQTADHAAAAKGYGMTLDGVRRVADQGMLFYRHGEMFNRRMSFSLAVERWKDAKGVKTLKGMSDSDLKKIMDDTNNLLLNMGKANRAPWQKGLLSLPTQFLQVTTKFLETALGFNENFTRMERGRLVFGQLALYGTAGVPLVSLGGMIAKEVFGMTQEDIDNNPTAVKAINDGVWGVWGLQLFGADVEMSSRGSLLSGVSDFIDNWFMEESSFATKMLGAFGSTGQRFFDDFAKRLRPISLNAIEDIDFSDIGALVASPVFSSFSSYNNMQKAIIMDRLDAAYSRSGRKVAEGFSPGDAFMQAMGFQPTKVANAYGLRQRQEYVESTKKAVQSDILNTMNDFAAKHPDGEYTDKEWEAHQTQLSVLKSVLDPDELLETQEFLRREMLGPSKLDYASSRYVENMKNDTFNDISLIQQTLLGSKLISTGNPTEEQE